MLNDVFVPLLTYPDRTTIEFAEDVAQFAAGFATHVTFAPIEIDVPDIANRWGSALIALPQMVAKVEADSRSIAHDLRQRTASEHPPLLIHHRMLSAPFGQVGPALVPHAAGHDLSLVGIESGSDEKAMLAEALIFGTGRPVMIAPDAALNSFDIRRIAIAWVGGRCASRAVFVAMPLITAASSVTILSAPDDKDLPAQSLKRLLDYLDRHGVPAVTRTIESKAHGIGEALQAGAADLGAGLLVMGAYGHSRLREFVMGGATRSIIASPKGPVLLSH